MRNRTISVKEIDRIDRRILRILQGEGRLPMTELAERIGLSVTPCAERVRRMEQEGIIDGYSARINPQRLGFDLLVFVELRLSAKSGPIFDQFRREVVKLPHVLECHLVSGDFDYLLKLRIPEIGAYRQVLGDMLLKLPAAIESRSYIVMEEIKESLALPIAD